MSNSGGFVPFQSFWDFLRNKNDDEFENSFDETYGDPNRSVDDSTRRGLMLILLALFFLFLLVLFRYCCFWIIDHVIMCDHCQRNHGFIRRNLSRCCPRWFPPVAPQPQADPEDAQGQSNDDDDHSYYSSDEGGTELVERNASYSRSLVRKLTEEQKRTIFSAILDSRKATTADISEEKRDQKQARQQQPCSDGLDIEEASTTSNASSSIAISDGSPLPISLDERDENNHACCPICIQDIEVGDQVYHCNHCQHLFHFDCMLGWVGTGSTLCPYCRREIVSRKMLEQAYRKLQPDKDPSVVV